MSVEASLNIHLGEYRIMDVVGVYMKRGLSVFDSDDRAFVITSDDYDRERLSVTFEELTKFIEDKERRCSPICITLYENGEPVTDVLKTTPDELSIACDINRRTFEVGGRRYTDVNWYIEKFIEPLAAHGFYVENFEYWQLH